MKLFIITLFCIVSSVTLCAQDITDFIPARLFRENKVKVMTCYTYHTTDSSEKYLIRHRYYFDSLGRCTRDIRHFADRNTEDTVETYYDHAGRIICKSYFEKRSAPYLENEYEYNKKGNLSKIRTGGAVKVLTNCFMHGDSLFMHYVRSGITDKLPHRIELFTKDHILKTRFDLWYNKPTRYLTRKNSFDKNGCFTELVNFNYDGKMVDKTIPKYNDKHLIIEDLNLTPTMSTKRYIHRYTYEFY